MLKKAPGWELIKEMIMLALVQEVQIELPPSTDLEEVKKAIHEHLSKDGFKGKGFHCDKPIFNKKTNKVTFKISGLCRYTKEIA